MAGPARIVAMGMGLLGGLVASQVPEFAQQYRQRLGGAIDELRRVVERFERDAQAVGQSRDGAVGQLSGNADELVRRQGEGMRVTIQRLETLDRQREAMISAGPFERLLVLVQNVDPAIAQAAYRDLEPAIPVTEEGVALAGGGFLAAWGGSLLLFKGLGGLFRRRRSGVRPA